MTDTKGPREIDTMGEMSSSVSRDIALNENERRTWQEEQDGLDFTQRRIAAQERHRAQAEREAEIARQALGQRMTGLEDDAAAFQAELERSGLYEAGEHEVAGEMAPYRIRSVDFLAPGTIAATKGPGGEWYGCAVTVGAETIDLSQGEWERIVLAIETIVEDKTVEQDVPHAISIGRWQFGFFPLKHQVVFATGERQMGHLAYGDWVLLVAQIRGGFEESETQAAAEVAPPAGGEFKL